jgi:hypothetical protein
MLVPLDLDKLKALAEDRGLTIALIMAELEVKCLPAEVEPELKSRIWQMLKKHEPIVGEIKAKFPGASVFCVRKRPE